MSPNIKIKGLGKQYRLSHVDPKHNFREALVHAASAPFRAAVGRISGKPSEARADDYVWALRDVSLDVMPGEVVGLIGRNGAGKSTLLKVLSRITEPTTGEVEIYGRVGSLLEVGTGFHPELTGRENILLSGAILGMRRGEVIRKFDEIVAFAEIEKFVDTPVKRYSSGMYVRLAFAVAAHLDPEILLVDEVLAVGDAAFQKRCLGKLGDVARGGRTVIFVSHNMASIESLCSSCVLMADGQNRQKGKPQEIISTYMSSMVPHEQGYASLIDHSGRRPGSIPSMISVTLSSDGVEPISAIAMGAPLSVKVSFNAERAFTPVLGVVVKNSRGNPVVGLNNKFISGYRFEQRLRAGTVSCQIDRMPLVPGNYFIDLWLGDRHHDFDVVFDGIAFEVTASDVFRTGQVPPIGCGDIFMEAEFSLAVEKQPNEFGKGGATSGDVTNGAHHPSKA
jgi:lipopolysaccharide transport system ATP-binding protein